jgi:isocitrate/isopropylmalate dehydrogenase
MSKKTIVIMPGDGIGKTVLPEALRVLKLPVLMPNTYMRILVGIFGARREILYLIGP